MGYTHYFTVHGWHTAEWQMVWPSLIQDTSLILEAADVLIAAPSDNIDNIVPPIVSVEEGIVFNGVADDGHETFRLTEQDHDQFVKTLQKPYDAAVACTLLRAYLLAPDNVEIYSDGFWNQLEWKKARQLYEQIWPQEPTRCPWGEADESDKDDGSENRKLSEASDAHSIINTEDEAADISRVIAKLHLDPTRLLVCVAVKSRISEVNYHGILQWLSHCDLNSTHSDCRASAIQWQNLPGVRFKVIDVNKRCIIDAPGSLSFAVLSYVWGGVNQPKLTADTAPLLMEDGGLNLIWNFIPATVRDAITVCKALGERYLWVDALCIMQDSRRDMKIQILRMRQIYSAAKFTIVAASAETADAGLIGKNDSVEIAEDESLDGFYKLIEECPWSSRAWCYQEKVLSHRAIFFTRNGVYLQCQNGTFTADAQLLLNTSGGTNPAKFNTIGGMLSIPHGADLESYISAVEYFSQRQLTDEGDKLNAFQGIMRRYGGKMDNEPSSFCFGLPISAFDQTFCWRTSQHNPHLRNVKFPSWSWLGWNNSIKFSRETIETARTSQIIYGIDEYNGPDTSHIRKPTQNPMESDSKFGFPTSAGGQFYNSPARHINASVADLIIGSDPLRNEGSNGLYAVYPAKCGQRPPPPPPKTMTLLEYLSQPMPEIKFMDAQTAAASSIPAKEQSEHYDLDEHKCHDNCEAVIPLGHIWLDRTWRHNQGTQCIRQFMPVAGKKDVAREGQWMITMLMCIQRMEKNGRFWAYERLQIMDCEIQDTRWVSAWAEISQLKLT